MDLSRERSTVYPPVTRDELAEIRTRCLLVGPRNCWTGTSGTAAADAWRLAAEVERLHELVAVLRGPHPTRR
jgi:hypothetical protein